MTETRTLPVAPVVPKPAASLLVLLAMPFLPQPAPAPVARVDADNCNGCRHCFDDCPYQLA